MKKFPTLYHKGKDGALWSWDIHTEGDTIYSEHGLVDGKKQLHTLKCEPKNVGRSNATTAEEQADKEATALWTFKLQRKYSPTPGEAQAELITPMLAHNYEKRLGAKKNGVTFPADVQPKLDGYRALGRCEYGKVVLYSRSGIPFDLPHITNQLSKILPNGAVVDGELYLHSVGFQTLGSWIKKAQPESANIEYHLYDMPSTGENKEGKPWVERKADLANLFAQNTFDKIYMVPSHPVANEKEVTEWHNEMTIEGGFEGAIVRLLDGVYNYGYRSYDLLKVKQFDDDEYPIVGYTNGKGKFTNCPIFSCRTKEGKTFDVVPKGTFEYRAQLLAEGDKYIGKHMTVIYFGKSDDGIPRFPVGKGFRLEEDR